MLLETLKQHMLLPEKEILINKKVEISGLSAILVSITSQGNKNVLWVLLHQPHFLTDEPEEKREYFTNREVMVSSICSHYTPHVHFPEIIIQGQKMTFSSSSAYRIPDDSYRAYMQLQHFVEKGMPIAFFDKIDLPDMMVASYEQVESEAFPEIDLSQEVDVTLKVARSSKEVLISQPLHLEFGNMEKGQKLSFYDSINEKDRFFFVDSIEHYDIWQEAEHHFSSEKMKMFSAQQIEEMKKQYFKCVEKTCPKGMDLAIIKYESEDNIQLNFYSKEFLDEKPMHNNGSSSTMFFISDKEPGINGLKSRICVIKPIPKDFRESMDIELFSWIMEIPEYSIRA